MFRYILKTLKHYRIQTLSLLAALVAVQSGVSTGILSLRQTQVNVSENIEKYSRDVYDILVRPKRSKNLTEELNGNKLIEPNYLAEGKGGISIEDWEKIKSIPDVEVAAPIASMGFFNNSTDGFKLDIPKNRAVRLNINFKTYDGNHEYPVSTKDKEDGKGYIVIIPDIEEPEAMPYVSSPTSNIGYIESPVSDDTIWMEWGIPPIYNFLVGVDMESESKLTGVKLEGERYFSLEPLKEQPQEGGQYYSYEIPVLINSGVKIPMKVEIQREKLEEIPDELNKLVSESNELETQIMELHKKREEITKKMDESNNPEDKKIMSYEIGKLEDKIEDLNVYRRSDLGQKIEKKIAESNFKVADKKNISVDLSKYLKAFQTTGIIFYPDGNVETTNQGLSKIAPALEYYTTEGIEYEAESKKDQLVLTPQPAGIKDGQIQYNRLEKKGKVLNTNPEEYIAQGNTIFKLIPMGSADFTGYKGNDLVRSPLGIYGSEKLSIGRKEVYPTTTLGTFLLHSAQGFTTLEAAKLLKGDKPIDAIRARVAGVKSYNEAGKSKIERVAEEIVQKTGFHVDIVAGSSPRNVRVNFSDYKGIPGMGEGITSWINLNTSTMVEERFNLLVFTVSIFFIIISLIFLYNRTQVYIWHRRREIEVLEGEGWSNNRISSMISCETVFVWLLSMIAAVIIGIFTKEAVDVSWPVFLQNFMWITLIGGAVLFFSGYVSTTKSCRKLFRYSRNKTKGSRKNISGKRTNSSEFLLKADMSYYGNRLVLMVIQILIGGTLCFFSWFAISAVKSDVTTTVLGDFIHARAGTWLKLIGISSLLLVVLTFFDSLLSYFDLRKKDAELLKQMGWQKKDLNNLIYPQVFLPVLLSSIFSLMMGAVFTKLIYNRFPVSLFSATGADMVLPALSLLMIYIWIGDMYRRREEIIKVKKIRIGLGVILSAVVIGAVFINIQRTGISHRAVDGKEIEEEKNIGEKGEEALEMIKKLTALGKRPVGSEANKKEVEMLCEFLEGIGLKVQKQKVEMPPYKYPRENSQLIINGEEVRFSAVTADLSPYKEGKVYSLKDDSPVLMDSENSLKQHIEGHIVLVDSNLFQKYNNEIGRKCLKEKALAVLTVDKGNIPESIEKAELKLQIVDLYQGYNSENIWVDIKGSSNKGESEDSFLIITNHGSVGPGAANNASGVASLAILAKEFKENPPPQDVRLLWVGGGEENMDGGISAYLQTNPKHSQALAVRELGTAEKLFFGFRTDNIYGQVGDIPEVAKDVTQDEIIRYVKDEPLKVVNVRDLGHPYSLESLKHDADTKNCVTPDKWMEAAQKISKEIKVNVQPTWSTTGMGVLLNNAGIKEADFWRHSPYSNTTKDKEDKLNSQTLGKDIYFLEQLVRSIERE